MPRFRLFGRPGGTAVADEPPAPPPAGATAPWGVPPVGAGAPATHAARPAFDPGARRAPAGFGDPRSPYADPPTDPFGFPPVPAAPHVAASVDRTEASALAAAFALDYLSWDEDDPQRRARVLRDYVATDREPGRLGWTGLGRQRAELALPGAVRSDGDGRVLVDVRVRVTPYREVGEHGPAPEPIDAASPGPPAAAPAPTGRGWRSLASCWIRLSVPVLHDGRRLVVDAWEETLGDDAPPAPRNGRAEPTGDDPTLADDDPLAEPVAGGVS